MADLTLADLHQAIYDSLKVPPQLQYLEQEIGKHVPNWPSRFFSAISLNANLELTWPKFALWLLEDELGKHETSKPVASLYRRWIDGKKPPEEEWEKAAWAAASAADAADAAYAARAAASAAAGAATAAWAARAATATATRTGFWDRAADKLISILGGV